MKDEGIISFPFLPTTFRLFCLPHPFPLLFILITLLTLFFFLCQVRRGADARCETAEAQAHEAQESCQTAQAAAEASRQEAQRLATSAEQAQEWQNQLNAARAKCASLEQQHQADQARLAELESQLAAVQEKAERDQEAVQKEIADAQQELAIQRKEELAAVDARVRKVRAYVMHVCLSHSLSSPLCIREGCCFVCFFVFFLY
jgi:DNA anti-recombination protein RmuC